MTDGLRLTTNSSHPMIDTDAIRIQIDELRGTITELRQDLADAEIEVGHLTDENKELTAAVKKECDDRDEVYEKFRVSEMNADTYKAEMDKRGNENTKLTEQNEQFFHEMANYKQERDTAKADLYLAEQRECVLEEQNKLMREALEHVTKKEGRFSTDQLTHAINCIDDMAETAQAALAATGEPK